MFKFYEAIELNKTRVRVKPEYSSMSKNFWLYSEKWRNQDCAKGECLVLGGEYTVWKIVGQVIYLQDIYNRYDVPNTISINDLIPETEFKQCSFKIGDIVRPKSQFDFNSFKSELPTYYEKYFKNNHHGEFEVVSILNEHYVFVDYEPLSDYSLPFPCNDFELIVTGN